GFRSGCRGVETGRRAFEQTPLGDEYSSFAARTFMTTIFRRLVPSIIALQCVVGIGCTESADVRKQRFLESGTRYFEQGKYREAAIEFRNATQIDPKFPDARLKLAQTHQR